MVDGFFGIEPEIIARLRAALIGTVDAPLWYADMVRSDSENAYMEDLAAHGRGVYLLPTGGGPVQLGGRGQGGEDQEWTVSVVVPAGDADCYATLGQLALRTARALHLWTPASADAPLRLTDRSAPVRAPTWLEVDITFGTKIAFTL